jgi:hypothetical protein
MDIEWCQSKVITSWNHLREEFQVANARKAIAPTQFNPMSTRGHCIMVMEVEIPDPDDPSIKKRGRVYVCDLAGTEPAVSFVFHTAVAAFRRTVLLFMLRSAFHLSLIENSLLARVISCTPCTIKSTSMTVPSSTSSKVRTLIRRKLRSCKSRFKTLFICFLDSVSTGDVFRARRLIYRFPKCPSSL